MIYLEDFTPEVVEETRKARKSAERNSVSARIGSKALLKFRNSFVRNSHHSGGIAINRAFSLTSTRFTSCSPLTILEGRRTARGPVLFDPCTAQISRTDPRRSGSCTRASMEIIPSSPLTTRVRMMTARYIVSRPQLDKTDQQSLVGPRFRVNVVRQGGDSASTARFADGSSQYLELVSNS